MRGDGGLYKRGRVYWIDYTGPDKIRHQESSKTSDVTLARKKLQALRRRVDAGQALTPTERRVTVNELLNDLQTHLEVEKRAYAPKAKSHMKALREAMGELRAGSIETAMVRKLQKAWQLEEKAPATINRRFELLRQAYRLAHRSTPKKVREVPYIPLLNVDNARQGFLPRADFNAVLKAVNKRDVDVGDYLEWFFWTSERPGEIKQLEWPYFDRETWTIHIPPKISKTRTGRSIAVEGPLAVIMKRRLKRRTLATPRIFHRVSKGKAGRPIGRYDLLWKAACEEVGLVAGRFAEGGLTPYDLRRTGLRNIVRATGSERAAMAYSGHKTRSTFDRYNIQSDADQRQAMSATSRYVRKLPNRRKVAQFKRPK